MRCKPRRAFRLVSAAVGTTLVIIFIQTHFTYNASVTPSWKAKKSAMNDELIIMKASKGEVVHKQEERKEVIRQEDVVVSVNETKVAERLFYSNQYPDDDRIVAQMNYVPKHYSEETAPLKTILVWDGLGRNREGHSLFERDNCPVKACRLTADRSQADKADMIRFQHGVGVGQAISRPKHQVWLFFLLESPYHSGSLRSSENKFNWSSTYRHDSTIVAPYEKFVPYDKNVLVKPQTRNYAEGKTKKVAWFVSNCNARNNRLGYAKKLGEYIQVDIYGSCGTLRCPRSNSEGCFSKLDKDYKFYLAFENSNCWDYITEKFYVNGLQHDVIPIVMGARPDDYRRQAPPNSFLHVDDFDSPKDLADYLNLLDTNDELYNKYFQWKGTGEFINTKWWCRACAMLHTPPSTHVIHNADAWWNGHDVCVRSNSWRDHGYKPQKPIGL